MSRTVRRSKMFGFAAVAFAAVCGLAFVATAQGPIPAPSGSALVIKGHSEDVEPQLSQDVQDDLFAIAARVEQLLPVKSANAINSKAFETEPTTMDFTAAVKDNRLRLDFGSSSILAKLGPDGSLGESAILDPKTGRVVKSAVSPITASGARDAATQVFRKLFDKISGGQTMSVLVTPGEVREIAGHAARGYAYAYSAGSPGARAGIAMTVAGTVWIAQSGPYMEELSQFPLFREDVEQQMFVALLPPPAKVTALARQGPILAKSEEVTITVWAANGEGDATPVPVQGSSSFEITSISRQPMDDTYFAGFEQAGQECDCTCAGWDELDRISKLPKDQQAANPKSMTLSMCAPKCAMKWIPCARHHKENKN